MSHARREETRERARRLAEAGERAGFADAARVFAASSAPSSRRGAPGRDAEAQGREAEALRQMVARQRRRLEEAAADLPPPKRARRDSGGTRLAEVAAAGGGPAASSAAAAAAGAGSFGHAERLAVMAARERALRAEVDELEREEEDGGARPPAVGPALAAELFAREMDAAAASARDAAEYAARELERRSAQLGEARSLVREREEMRDELKARARDARAAGRAAGGTSARARLERLAAAKVATRNAIMTELLTFVERHFPVEGARASAGGREIVRAARGGPKQALKDLVLQLLNRAVHQPDDPFVRLQEGLEWPPYVELLLRAGVAEKHPADSSRLRLVPFHED